MLDKPDAPDASASKQHRDGAREVQAPVHAASKVKPAAARATLSTRVPVSGLGSNAPGTSAEQQRDGNYNLVQPDPENWNRQPAKVVKHYYDQAESDYFGIVNDYLTQANLAADRYKEFSTSHSRWRFWTIMATGGLAVINVCAAFDILNIKLWGEITLPKVLNAFAALYAGGLTVAGNVENFLNKGEKAGGFRESRDLLLNRYREYCFKWFYYVEAHGKTAQACVNAGRLYRQLVDSDQELRQKLKQLTEVQKRGAGEAGSKTNATPP